MFQVRHPRCARVPAAAIGLSFGALGAGLTAPATAQMFQKSYGTPQEERSEWIIQTADGGYAICGFLITDTLVMRTDAGGNLLWTSRIGGEGFFNSTQMLETSDGGLVVAGEQSIDSSGLGVSLMKLDGSGNLQWAFAYPGTPFAGGTHGQTALRQTPDGGFILAGRIQAIPDVSQAPLLLRTDADGNLLWAKYYIDLQFQQETYGSFNDVDLLPDALGFEGFVAVGWTAMNVFGQRESLVVVTDDLGNPIWARTYGEPTETDIALAVDPAANSDLIVSGFTKAIGEGGGTYVLRTDILGTLLLYRTFRFFKSTNSMEELPNGDIILGGSAEDFAGLQDASLMRTDANAAFLWSMAYGGAAQDFGEAVAPRAGGGFGLIGWTGSFGQGLFDLYFVKSDANGQSGCNEMPHEPLLDGAFPPEVDVDLQVVTLDRFNPLDVFKARPALVEEDLCGGCIDPPPDLVAWWPLDELAGTVAREIVNNNDGTHVNGPTPLAGEFVDNALCFDGMDDYVEVPDAPELNFGTGDFSMDAWIRTSQTVGVMKIVDHRVEAASATGYTMFVTSGNLAFQIADGSGSPICAPCPTAASCTNYDSGFVVADGAWHLVAVTLDRTAGAGTFYVDGVPVSVFDISCHPNSVTNTNPLRIASRSSSVSGLFDGCIDEVELFDRRLLDMEILEIFNAGTEGKCKPETCPWDLDGDGLVSTTDLLIVLSRWGLANGNPADFDNDGFVGTTDLLKLLANWGPCP